MSRSYGVDDLMSKIGSLKITIEIVFFMFIIQLNITDGQAHPIR